ncbi:MAG: hypothetical protein ACOYT8_00230 [Candidatus Dependentiae bacterium]
MKQKSLIKSVYLCMLSFFINFIQTEVIKHTIALPSNQSLYCIVAPGADHSYFMFKKNRPNISDVQEYNDLICFKAPYIIDLLLWELLPNNDLFIGYFKNGSSIVGLVFDNNDNLRVQEVIDIAFRSCFEYANPITRTFDQLNIRRCMRVGGDLIVCGKIINDPVCNVTPCATQIER